MDVVSSAVKELAELGGHEIFLHLGVMSLLFEFASHGIQHEFGSSALAEAFFSEFGMTEDNAFSFVPALDVLALRVSRGAV